MLKILNQLLPVTCAATCTVIILLLNACGSNVQEPVTRPGNPSPATLVRAMTVGIHKMNEVLELPGNLEAESIANVLSTTEGKLTTMSVREGDRVESGQIVAMLSPLLREDIINAARITLQTRERALNEDPGDGSLKIQLEQARSDYQFALNQYREIPVIAPVSGLISGRWADTGDMIPARFKMLEIQSGDNLVANVPVSELDIRKLRAGQTVRIDSDACPDRTFQGRIQRIHPRVDRQTRNATVEILLQNPCPQLRAGMFVRASFVIQTTDNALSVPVAAIMERGRQRSVFIIEEGQAREVIIETGIESNGLAEVVSGLKLGDQLVIEGQEQLRTGMRVRVPEETSGPTGGGML